MTAAVAGVRRSIGLIHHKHQRKKTIILAAGCENIHHHRIDVEIALGHKHKGSEVRKGIVLAVARGESKHPHIAEGVVGVRRHIADDIDDLGCEVEAEGRTSKHNLLLFAIYGINYYKSLGIRANAGYEHGNTVVNNDIANLYVLNLPIPAIRPCPTNQLRSKERYTTMH